MKKNKNTNRIKKVSKPHFHAYFESDWITNFWFADNELYLTDSVFSSRKNILAKIDVNVVLENLKIKRTDGRAFISHPNAAVSSALTSSITDVELIEYYDEFVYNVFKFDDVVYVSLIKNDHNSKVIAIDENGVQTHLEQYDNYLVIGQIEGSLILKAVDTRQTYINGQITEIENIKKIVYTDGYYIIQTENNYLYKVNKQTGNIEIIKDDTKEVNISNFDNQTFVISEKESRITYIINNSGKEENIANNYFYRLDCYRKMLLVGKPLFTEWGTESYTQPITFID